MRRLGVRPQRQRLGVHAGFGQGRQAVAQIPLGERADTDARAGVEELTQLRRLRVGAVNRGDPGADVDPVEQQSHRGRAVGGERLLDLEPLLLEVEVEHQAAAPSLGGDLLELARIGGAHAVDHGAEAGPLGRGSFGEPIHPRPVRFWRGHQEAALTAAELAADAAGPVVGVEQHQVNPRLGGRLQNQLVESVVLGLVVVQVVKLADRGDAGAPHLSVGLDRKPSGSARAPSPRPAGTWPRARSRSCRRRPRTTRPAPRRPRWKACEWAFTNPGISAMPASSSRSGAAARSRSWSGARVTLPIRPSAPMPIRTSGSKRSPVQVSSGASDRVMNANLSRLEPISRLLPGLEGCDTMRRRPRSP